MREYRGDFICKVNLDQSMEQPWKGVKSINGLLWIILGLLIFIWLIYPTEIIESLLWLGFGIGCILVGLIQFKDLKLLLD